MRTLFLRMYRELCNPWPMEGQRWRVDGIGVVEILKSSNTTMVRFEVVGCNSKRATEVSRMDFVGQSDLWKPSASELVL